jgi:hypothetical protein
MTEDNGLCFYAMSDDDCTMLASRTYGEAVDEIAEYNWLNASAAHLFAGKLDEPPMPIN